jgi:ATP-dependent helicase/nuclease subunit B
VPERPALDSLPVTAFRDYLQCPLRFYFKHVLQMRRFDARKAEMDALDFGSVLHETVGRFANNESIRDSSDAAEIEKFVLAESEVIFADRFGKRLNLPVRVQRESLRARLRRFARLQARERESGWRIQCGELRFEKEDTLVLATLPIVGSLDRVDIHEATGKRRILDYKTSAQRSSANEFHFEEGDGQLDPFHLLIRGKLRRWKDLQLPLYRALARLRWPGEDVSPSVSYFFLPERIDESSIEEFALDDAVFNSAMSCAQAVAENIGRGIFWPPRAVEYDDYDTIFLGEDPGNVLSKESKRLLNGFGSQPAP